jgi:hypothetical protein
MFILSLALVFGGVAFYFVTLSLSVMAFRKVVDFQFQNYNDAWVSDGRPIGGKITRRNLSFFRSDFATFCCGISWTISRPNWLPRGSVTDKFRTEMIRWFLISLIGFLAVAAGIVLFIISVDRAG